MAHYEAYISGHSDDLITVEILYTNDNNVKVLHNEEYSFRHARWLINDSYFIHIKEPHKVDNWMIGIEINDESNNLIFNGNHIVSFENEKGGARNEYSPTIKIVSDEPIVIEGIYGDGLAKIIYEVQKVNVDLSREDIENIVSIVKITFKGVLKC